VKAEAILDSKRCRVLLLRQGPGDNKRRAVNDPNVIPRDRSLSGISSELDRLLRGSGEFQAQANKSKLDITYVSGEEAEKRVGEVLSISAKVRDNLQSLSQAR
jgi:hypothetical protein